MRLTDTRRRGIWRQPIIAHLMAAGDTPDEIITWLVNNDVEGTEFEYGSLPGR
jgi:hypothetical protein